MRSYTINKELSFDVGDPRGVSLRAVIIDEDEIGDIYTIAITYSNLKKLLSEIRHSRTINWSTKDGGLLVRGSTNSNKLVF